MAKPKFNPDKLAGYNPNQSPAEIEHRTGNGKLPTYKQLARYGKSSIESPCEFVHQFCNEHAELTRKQAIAALMERGINYSTARTQYQKWFAARPAIAFKERNEGERNG